MNKTRLGMMIGTALLLGVLGTQGALAADLQISGSITQEMGIKITGKRNENNVAGNPFNGLAEPYRGLSGSETGGGLGASPGSQGNH